MLSIGNDIVALNCINIERSNDKKFYSKILAESEQELYRNSIDNLISFDKYLWMLWSVKESAFKYLKRKLPYLVFSPTKIIVQQINLPANFNITTFDETQWEGSVSGEECFTGNLIFGDETFYFNSKIYYEFIATVVSDDINFENTIWGISKIEQSNSENQSKEIRELLLNKLNLIFPRNDLKIEKNIDGCPVVINKSGELNFPVSIAHHGRFVGYSLQLNPKIRISKVFY